jgi:hypothetical protein
MSSAGRQRSWWQARGSHPEVCHSRNLHRYLYLPPSGGEQAGQDARSDPEGQQGATAAAQGSPGGAQAVLWHGVMQRGDPNGRQKIGAPPGAARGAAPVGLAPAAGAPRGAPSASP